METVERSETILPPLHIRPPNGGLIVCYTEGRRFAPPDGRYVATGAKFSTVKVWTFDDSELVASFTLSGPDVIMETVEFSPDGRFLLTGGTEGNKTNNGLGNIRFYRVPRDPGDNYELVLTEPVFRQEYLHFNSDGSQLVSSHEDGTLRLWQVLAEPLQISP